MPFSLYLGSATMSEATGVELTEHRYYHCAIENGDTPILTGGANLVPVKFTIYEMDIYYFFPQERGGGN